MNVQNKMNSVRITPALWALARADMVAGASLAEAAALHGVKAPALRVWAVRDGYDCKAGVFGLPGVKKGVSPSKKGKIRHASKIVHAAPAPVFPLSSFIPPPISADAAASDFSASLIPHVQALIAAGLPGIEPPRNIGELKTLIELGRKLAGLDAKQSSGKVQLFAPLRDVSRRGGASHVVVECSDGVQDADSADSIGDYEV
jgi:hypothetical protein